MSAEMVIQINLDGKYDIEEVADKTGYSTGHLRHLEKAGKIPKSVRDERGWRLWTGADMLEIQKYQQKHPSPLMKKKGVPVMKPQTGKV